MMACEPLCRLHEVSKYFRPRAGPKRWALRDLSLTLSAGEVLGLLGPPGSGKSTLLQLLAGRLRPSAGQVWRPAGTEQPLTLLDEPADQEVIPPPGGAAVIATTSTALAYRRCDRVLLLDQGRALGCLPAAALAPWASQSWYRIRVQGHLTPRTLTWLADLTCTATPQGETTLLGALPDTAALYGVLHRIERLNLPLLEVATIDPLEPLLRHYAIADPALGPC